MIQRLLLIIVGAGVFTWSFVIPAHIYMTGESLQASVLDCKIIPLHESEPLYEIITDYTDEPYLGNRCNRWKCEGAEPRQLTWLHRVMGAASGPSCGDIITVLRSTASGRYLLFEGEPSILKAWFASTSGTWFIVKLLCLVFALRIAFDVLYGCCASLKMAISREFVYQVSANAHQFAATPVAVLATVTSTLVLLVLIASALTATFVACRMILLSSLPSEFALFTVVTSLMTVLLLINTPKGLAERLFDLHQHRLLRIVRDLVAIVGAVRITYCIVVVQQSATEATLQQLGMAVFRMMLGLPGDV
ncbi:MAG: hypothetical protein NVV68_05740 [Dokdonella sp.]|jgi:hypothetical protein|nr:hypothetical protein [Dokdonella sp.]